MSCTLRLEHFRKSSVDFDIWVHMFAGTAPCCYITWDWQMECIVDESQLWRSWVGRGNVGYIWGGNYFLCVSSSNSHVFVSSFFPEYNMARTWIGLLQRMRTGHDTHRESNARVLLFWAGYAWSIPKKCQSTLIFLYMCLQDPRQACHIKWKQPMRCIVDVS